MSNNIIRFVVSIWLGGIIFLPSAALGVSSKVETLPASRIHDQPDGKGVSQGKENFPLFYGYQKLIGTMLVSDKNQQRKEAVLLNLLTGEKTTYQEKMTLPFGVRLKQVSLNRVTLEKDGHLKELSLRDQSQYQQQIRKLRKQGYLKVGSREWVVDAHGLFGNSEDIIGLVLKSGLQFQYHQGKSLIKVGETAKDSKLADLGFVSGDQILQVNDVDLNGTIGLFNSYKGIRKTEKVTIKVLRDDKVIPLSYWVNTKGKIRYDMEKVFADPGITKLFLTGTDLR